MRVSCIGPHLRPAATRHPADAAGRGGGSSFRKEGFITYIPKVSCVAAYRRCRYLRANRLINLGHAYLTIERFPRFKTKQGRCKLRLLCHPFYEERRARLDHSRRNIDQRFPKSRPTDRRPGPPSLGMSPQGRSRLVQHHCTRMTPGFRPAQIGNVLSALGVIVHRLKEDIQRKLALPVGTTLNFYR